MKRSTYALITILVIEIFIFIALPLQLYVTRTPELLRDAPAVIGRYGELTIGVVWNDYAGFLLYSRGEQCYLLQAFGGHVGGANGPIKCLMVWRNERFRGWIEFRGHPRKFCGAESLLKLPDMCMWR